jgi:hypothetical protein
MLLLAVTLALAGAKPEVSFSAEGGFVTLRLEGPAGPIADAIIKAYDHVEFVFAEGETDEAGIGTFPAPAGGVCRIGITIKGKECDLIPLHVRPDAVDPPRVQLTFGTRPCCRFAVKRSARDWSPLDDEPGPPPDRTALLFATGGAFVGVAAAMFLIIRPWARR